MNLLEAKAKLKSNDPLTFCVSKQIKLNTSRYRLAASAVVTLVLLCLVLWNTKEFFFEDVPSGALLYFVSIAVVLLTGAAFAFQFSIPVKTEKWLARLAILLIPIGTMAMAECLNGVYIGHWAPLIWVYNCIFYALLYMAVFAVTGRRNIPFLVVNPIIYMIALTNHYVMAFRGSPFLPVDLLYIKTAASVADGYTFTLDYQVIAATVLFVFMISIACQIKTGPQKLWKKIYYRTLSGLFALFVLGGYLTTNVLSGMGLAPFFFNQTQGYQTYGVSLSFFMNVKYINVSAPNDYDADEIEALVYELIDESELDNEEPAEQITPNIICIMNESLSDLSVLGPLKTNKDYMPFLHSLEADTIKGNLYVSVIGGGTSNTEFEFLTGASTAFLPAGSNAFTLYVNQNMDNFVTTLESHGYSSTAFHPFYKENWNRVDVYHYLNFDNYIALEDMTDELRSVCQDDGVCIRGFVSDAYDYKTVIELYEQQAEGVPFFMFNVTMQNHGGYEAPSDSLVEEIYFVDENNEKVTTYPEANRYLSLIYESDKALEELIGYFSEQDEPTVICIFGDHQPNLEDGFIEELQSKTTASDSVVAQRQARYCTPFYIWANYDIEEKEVEMLSVNYLASYLMDVVGIDMPAFNQYLLSLSETLPVIDSVGYIDADGNYYTYDDESEYSELLSAYEKICYNYIFDEDNIASGVFRVSH